MARRRTAKFKLPGFREWLDDVSEETARAGVAEIVQDLKTRGPYWTGHFEESWVVEPGDVRIPATDDNPLSADEKWEGWASKTLPLPRRVTPVPIPTGFHQFTIGNKASYRNIALDLVPGRFEPGRANTAPQDWYQACIQGGGMAAALERGTNTASRNPKIRGFNSRRSIRRGR